MPDFLVNPIDPLGTGRPSPGGRPDSARILASLEAGDVLTAQILARLPGGIYRVVVGGQQMRMALPDYLTPGRTVELRVVTREPQLTFALKEGAPAPSLSSAARLLSALVPQSGALPAAPAAPSASATAPATAPDSALLANGLARSLGQSGLFYEAHLAQWLAGDRSLSQIMEEPQARSAPTPLPAPAPAATGGSKALAPDMQALALVQYQVAALDAGRVLLQLEAWPGQRLQWEIEERRDTARPEAAPCWRTRVDLELPQLGRLSAALALGAQQLDIRIEATEADAATLLEDNRLVLQNALAEAGLPASIAIRNHAGT